MQNTKYEEGVELIHNGYYISGLLTIAWNYLIWWTIGPATYMVLSSANNPQAIYWALGVGITALLLRASMKWAVTFVYAIGVFLGFLTGVVINSVSLLVVSLPLIAIASIVYLATGQSNLVFDIFYPAAMTATALGTVVGLYSIVTKRAVIADKYKQLMRQL